jgi:hypothetical protein
MHQFKSRNVVAARIATLVVVGLVLSGFGGFGALRAMAAQPAIIAHPVTVHPEMQPAGTPTNAAFNCQTNRGPNFIVC